MLATAGPLPSGPGWAYELKWDGIRALVEVDGEQTRIRSRNGNDLTARFPEFGDFGGGLPAASLPLVLDGEIVAFDERGRPSFHALQSRIGLTGERRIASAGAAAPAQLILFDLLVEGGSPLTELPYRLRRERLERLAPRLPAAVAVPRNYDDGAALLERAVELGIEGVVAKRRNGRYRAGARSADWVKVKLKPRQEFVVGGWTIGAGHRARSFGALLVGYHETPGDTRLRYAGAVGSGFGDADAAAIAGRLAAIESAESPFAGSPTPAGARFARPELVAEVEYQEFTPEGRLRHPVFKGLRADKPASEVVYEGDPR